MMFRQDTLTAIRDGRVTLAYRRWHRARVRPGHPTAAALLADLPGEASRQLFRVELGYAGADPRIALRADDALDPDTLTGLVAALTRMDRSSRRGPWTTAVLALIEENPAVRAPDLAPRLGYTDTLAFKRDVRRLKELGLTESLPVGYRLAPRGAAVLAHLRA